MGQEERFKEYKRNSSKVWGENKYKSKKTEEVGNNGKKRLLERQVTRKVYGKNVV